MDQKDVIVLITPGIMDVVVHLPDTFTDVLIAIRDTPVNPKFRHWFRLSLAITLC